MGSRLILILCLLASTLYAADYRGQVTFHNLPVPGATVTATRGDQQFSTITDPQGSYVFLNLADGPWTISIEMTGFSAIHQDITVAPNTPPGHWELRVLPLDQIQAKVSPPMQLSIQPPENKPENSATTDEGFLINGSVNNGAASPFAQSAAFGNRRFTKSGLYNGGLGLILDNSALDAAPFSLTGQRTPKPTYNDLNGIVTFGGPLRIPHLLENGPNVFATYERTQNSNAATDSGLVPTLAQRNGIFASPVLDPLTGAGFPGNVIPQDRISPQARALLNLYPLPNFQSNARYNYQIPITTPAHKDALQSRINKFLSNRNQLYGGFAFQSTRQDTPNLFGFLDTSDSLGLNTNVNWWHRLSQEWFVNVGFQFSRLATHLTPYFENRENVSGIAGISGNNQSPMNWGPPALTFSSGISGLNDGLPEFNRNQTSRVSYSAEWNHRGHNITLGGDFRRQEFNYLAQQDPRGSFTFTGAATGNDFAGFLLGIPDTSSIAFGNADKYFRESVYDAYFTDDWRVGPQLTINAGMRWEYGAPITELYGRLVNLNLTSGFTAANPVIGNGLLRPDKSGFEPRIGIAWRPVSGSSLVVRAGYGIYRDTSVYQNIVLELSQQPPLSKTLNVANSPADPITLANGFQASPLSTPNTFAVDPNFRVGYAQEWNASIQRDLPGSLQMTASYLGIKGTRGVQEFLPNTYAPGAANPCPACPAGFVYLTSNGNSSREAAQLQLRRRLHNGLTAMLQYTFSKSIDDDAMLGGQSAQSPSQNSNETQTTAAAPTESKTPPATIAQNWQNLSAERSLSFFDQRHLLTLMTQYTIKGWTFGSSLTAGTGLPETPIYLTPVPGTGFTGTIRPEYIGGAFPNPAAYTAPLPGQWGNAGRNSITGPSQFVLNTSLGRTFRLKDRWHLDLRADATNVLNHVSFTSWNTTVNNAQFGLPIAAQPMRTMQLVMRLRF